MKDQLRPLLYEAMRINGLKPSDTMSPELKISVATSLGKLLANGELR